MPSSFGLQIDFLGCRAGHKNRVTGAQNRGTGAQNRDHFLGTKWGPNFGPRIQISIKGVFFEGPFSGLGFRVRRASLSRRVRGHDFWLKNDHCARLLYVIISAFMYGSFSRYREVRQSFFSSKEHVGSILQKSFSPRTEFRSTRRCRGDLHTVPSGDPPGFFSQQH